MSQLPENLSQMFDDYLKMQKHHLNEIETIPDFDIKKQNFERSKAFANLKNELWQTLRIFNKDKNNESHLTLAHECKRKISEILDTDRVIYDRIENYKMEIKKRLVKMNTGKKVLSAYKRNVKY